MSVESLPNPGDPAIRGTVPNEQNKTGDPDLDGWAQLRQIAAASTAMNVTAGQVMADLARALATRDLAAQNELIERGELPPKYRKSAAQILDEARICVQDTAVATLGGPPGEWAARIALGLAPESIAGPVRAAVSSHAISFAQACALVRDVGAPEVGPEAGQRVCDAVVEYATAKAAATGAPVSQGHFCAKKRREMVKYVSTTRRRTLAMKDRRAWVKPHDDGVASFGVTGADARCLGAYRRVDAIARSRRRQGDPRTLDQLRADAALDLLLFGRIDADAPTKVDHPGQAGWPAAVVSVVVSAGSLLGLNDEPGTVECAPVAAATVRDLAYAAGSTWRRLVVDPVTGYAMAQVSDSHTPPPRMARAVRDRDGTCRAPGCNRPAEHCDLDHVREKRDGGVTAGDELADACRRDHSKKTRRHWLAQMSPDGVIRWRLPDGRVYPTYPMDYREFGLEPDEPRVTGESREADGSDEPDEPGGPRSRRCP